MRRIHAQSAKALGSLRPSKPVGPEADLLPGAAMPGFGPKSTHRLHSVGIMSVQELKRPDPFAVYAQLKRDVAGTSLNFLYAFIAAHEGIDWRVVQETRRTEIVLRLDDMGIAPGSGFGMPPPSPCRWRIRRGLRSDGPVAQF